MKLKVISLLLVCGFIRGESCDERTIENVTFHALKDNDSNERPVRKGILVYRPKAKATVLVLHGYTRDKSDAAPLRLLLKNFNVFSFDFRAHGEDSVGQLSTMGYDEVHDVFGAVDYLRSRPELRDKPIFVMAFSMGAATAIEAQALDNSLFAGMYLDTPFHSSAQVIKAGVERMKIKFFGYEFCLPGKCFFEKYAFNEYFQPVIKMLLKLLTPVDGTRVETLMKPITPFESIKKVKIPCQFVVCVNDKEVPYQDVIQIYENHPGPARIWIADGRWHCDALFNDPEFYDDLLNGFFNEIVSGNFLNEKKVVRSCL